jgi:site-specific recombinase XerD
LNYAPSRRAAARRKLRYTSAQSVTDAPPTVTPSPYLFTIERHSPMTAAGFRKQLAVIGLAAKLPFPIHPHMLRHACGYALANDRHDTRAIQEWLGHRNIQHTTRYTELTTHRFKDFWQRED